MKQDKLNKPPDRSVQCYAGYKGEEAPRVFYFAGRRIEVEEILSRWLTPDERGFKAEGGDGAVYTLRLSLETGRWEVARVP